MGVRRQFFLTDSIDRLRNTGRRLSLATFGNRLLCRKRASLKLIALVASWGFVGVPALAQESSEAEAIARYKAISDLEKAQADLAQQRLKTLGLTSDTKGETKLEGKGGEFEGWLLSAQAINRAADALGTKLQGQTNLVLLAGDEKFDLGLPAAMQKRLSFLQAQTNQVFRANCGTGGPAPSNFIGGAAPYLGALISAFRTDTTIRGFDGPTDARLVVAALASKSIPTNGTWIVPTEMVGAPSDSPLFETWSSIEDRRGKLGDCRAALAAQGDKTKAQVAAIDAQLKAIDDFATKQVGAGDVVSPLIQAARLEKIASLKPTVVRIYVEKAGGSILLRRNLFTMLGAPAVGITGGTVVSWRLTNPEYGQLLGGGVLACRTELSNMRSIHRGKVAASSCQWREQ